MSFHGPMSDTPEPTRALPPQTTPIYDAKKLTGAEGTAMIVLDDKTYTLRITRAGKLILTK